MFRTTIIAIAFAAAALVPTVASAKGGGHHGHHGLRGFGVTFVDRSYSDDCSWQLVKVGRNLYKKQWVCG